MSCCASAPAGHVAARLAQRHARHHQHLVLALSAITTLLAWAACKVRQFGKFKFFHACTLLLALTFLCIKSYEYHDKWIHYEIHLTDGNSPTATCVEKSADFDLVK
jgi:heme/copper-type cytochrome/quinol oxidase subunit 3